MVGYLAPTLNISGSGSVSVIARTLYAGLWGGLASTAAGGSFNDGAFQAAMVHLFNTEGDRLIKSWKCLGSCHDVPDRDLTMMSEGDQKSMATVVSAVASTPFTGAIGAGGVAIGAGVRLGQSGSSLMRGLYSIRNSVKNWWVGSGAATMTYGSNPAIQSNIVDFVTSAFPGSSTLSPSGVAGALVGNATNPESWLR